MKLGMAIEQIMFYQNQKDVLDLHYIKSFYTIFFEKLFFLIFTPSISSTFKLITLFFSMGEDKNIN